MKESKFEIIPMGFVERSELLADGEASRKQEATIRIEPSFLACCEGIEELSHALVIWWAHERESKRFDIQKVQPKGRKDLPFIGLFCTRSPVRPNPLCTDIVEILSFEGNALVVTGLDAHRGTPVLDIKGWYASVPDEEVKKPGWYKKLTKE